MSTTAMKSTGTNGCAHCSSSHAPAQPRPSNAAAPRPQARLRQSVPCDLRALSGMLVYAACLRPHGHLLFRYTFLS